jgi:hypothetical protein
MRPKTPDSSHWLYLCAPYASYNKQLIFLYGIHGLGFLMEANYVVFNEWTFGFHKIRRSAWLAEEMLASQEGICSLELVGYIKPDVTAT